MEIIQYGNFFDVDATLLLELNYISRGGHLALIYIVFI